MTHGPDIGQDVQDALDICRNDSRSAQSQGAPVVGLTPRSRKRISAMKEVEPIFAPRPTAKCWGQ
jgi:hypothetical protein